jgi:hypothetical protein
VYAISELPAYDLQLSSDLIDGLKPKGNLPRVTRSNNSTDSIVMKVSECWREREEALRLVHRVYSRTGLADGTSAGIRVMRQHLSDDTEILVATKGNQVVFTVTLVRDSVIGLPLESLFEEEVESMRSQGIRLAEISCLAFDTDLNDNRARFNTFVQAMSLLGYVARRKGVDRLLLAVHPRHAKVYERLFGCIRCSEAREYAAVRGNPAILCMHDFASLDETGYPLHRAIYSTEFEPWNEDDARMSEAEKTFFRGYLPKRDHEVLAMVA